MGVIPKVATCFFTKWPHLSLQSVHSVSPESGQSADFKVFWGFGNTLWTHWSDHVQKRNPGCYKCLKKARLSAVVWSISIILFCGCSDGAYLLLLRKRLGDGVWDGRVQAAMDPTGWDTAKRKSPDRAGQFGTKQGGYFHWNTQTHRLQ